MNIFARMKFKENYKMKTFELCDNQFLIMQFKVMNKVYCTGYTDNKRDENLDGYYLKKQLFKKNENK